MTTNNRTTKQVADQKLIDGLEKHVTIVPSLFIGGQTLKNADVVQKLQQFIVTANAANSTRVTWQAAVSADRTVRAANRQFVDDLKQTLRAMFSGQMETLADFGLTVRKSATPKPGTKVTAAAKAKATRTARGTKGKKQKSVIKGVLAPQATPAVPVPVASPAAAPVPAAATPAAAPAPALATPPKP